MIMERASQNGELLVSFLEAAARGNLEEVIGGLRTDPSLINTPHSRSGNTALIVAAGENRSEVISLLLEHGADVTLYNSTNQTAVHIANDVIRTQLLAAMTRTSFPQLALAQAAWQGDLETIQHRLTTEHWQYVNTRNEQGLTPVMLVVRDIDLFYGRAMEDEYRPAAVLQELLKHHADIQLLDSSGKSALNYASEAKSPLRQQLIDVLEKTPSQSDIQDEASCDFCPDTKPPLSNTPLPRPSSPNIQSREPGKELSCDGFSNADVSEKLDTGSELRTLNNIEAASALPHAMENVDQMHGKKKNSFSREWFTNPSPEHLTPWSATDPSPEHLTPRSATDRSPEHLTPRSATDPSPEHLTPRSATDPSPEHLTPRSATDPSPEHLTPRSATDPSPEHLTPRSATDPSPEHLTPRSATDPSPEHLTPRSATDPSPEHLTPRSATKRQPSLSPLHLKKDENIAQLESLGLGYLVQGSLSEPNILESHLGTDPLWNIKYIKERIWKRLGSAEASRDSKTFPPLSRSPRSSQSVRLKPLPKTSLRSKEENDLSHIALNSDTFVQLRVDGLHCGQNTLEKSLRNSEDLVLSKDLVQISLDSLICSESTQCLLDDRSSRSAQKSIRAGSGRRENMGNSENCDSTRRHSSYRNGLPELHGNNETLMRSSEESASHLQDERLQIHKQCEEIMRERHSEKEEYFPDTRGETEVEKQDGSFFNGRMANKHGTAEEVVEITKAINEDAGDLSRTPRLNPVPFVHITFSEQGAEREIHHPPLKHFFVNRKKNLGPLTHNVSHSFNILAQKGNEKTKKTRKTRITSAPDCATKQQRPLSNSNRTHGRVVPLPALVFSSMPSPSKVSKKATRTEPSSIDRSRQRSQTQLSLYTKKRLSSSDNTAVLPRAKTAHDFQDLKYSDMFIEIKSQDNGPLIWQMFETPVYVNPSNPCRETNSAPPQRSGSSKSISPSSSRKSSGRTSKRTKSKNKTPSATSNRRRNSLTKPEVREDVEKNTENSVIISGMDWQIKTITQDVFNGNNVDIQGNGITTPDQQTFSDLSIIKEATIENSLTINGTVKATLIKMFRELERSSNNVESTKPVDVNETEGVQQTVCLTNSNSHGQKDGHSVHVPDTGSLMQPSQDLNGAKKLSEVVPQARQEATLVDLSSKENFRREILTENSVNENNLNHVHSVSQTFTSIDDYIVSVEQTDELISLLEQNLLLRDEESNGSRTLVNQVEEDDQSPNIHDQQHMDDHGQQSSNLKQPPQFNRTTSLKDGNMNTNHYNLTDDHLELNHNDNPMKDWMKGEVLGRGAYGTVYRGLTSQGELIAAKQVRLHGSDPAVAEKEYKKLEEEVDLLKTLKHINIVGYLGTSLQDHVVTIFMEFVPGGSISSNLRHFGPLQEVVISKYTNHILQGIAYLHRNRVVHRDIKGNNVMLMPDGVIKLIDFGCAKRLNGLNMNGTRGEMLKSMHGTPYWMAPEVISESGHGEKSDIWSIGCTVFEMATGKPPLAHMNKLAAMFYIGAQRGLMPTLPDQFSRRARSFVDLCLTRDQEDRPSAEQLLKHSFIQRNI